MRTIRKQLIDEKPSNLVGYWGGKPKTGEVSWWKLDSTSSIKNLLTQTRGRGGKPNNQLDEKPFNSNGK